MSLTNSIDLLLKEIEDPYVQENFYRLKLYLERLDSGGGTGSITQNINVTQSDHPWEKFTQSISASSTSIVDTIALTAFVKIEYTIEYRDTTTNRVKGLKMSVVKDDTLLKDQVYAISGAPLNIELNTNINGSNYELEIVNNELNAVEMVFARLTLP